MKFIRHYVIEQPGHYVVDYLAENSGLSKTAIKDCLNKGAVWLKKKRRKEGRLRRARHLLNPGDRLSLYYDSQILSQAGPEPRCLHEEKQYSVWIKPAGLLSQGTRFGDHCSLLRYAEKKRANAGQPYLLHRLDRDASGLVLIAHDSKAAAALSALFQSGKITKKYKAIAQGLWGTPGEQISLDMELDGKGAITEVTILNHNQEMKTTGLDIRLITGRHHQIRRHAFMSGYPLVGDKIYGDKGYRVQGSELMLEAYYLSFRCPFSGREKSYTLEASRITIHL